RLIYMRQILHLDMDAFFAAVEQKRDPEIIGRPVVIGGNGDPTKRGVVSTASYEARKYGIHSAMPLKTAYKLCPEAVFLPVDYPEYLRVSIRVKNILIAFSGIIEDVGIDEAFLDISQSERSSEEIAREIKKRIKDEIGLTCSIGIAPNKLLAKMASDMQKPDGLTVITENNIKNRIWPLSARRLQGVGPKTEAHLKSLSISTIKELASLSLDNLIDQFGRSFGSYLYNASRGIDNSPLITCWEPKSTSRETTFQNDIDNWQVMAKTLAELARNVVSDMKQAGYKGRTVTVKIKFNDFKIHTRSKTIYEATNSLEEARRAAFECLGRFEIKKKVRLIGVRISQLKKI
ncbi:DNA polymerase IV, partial [Thermodesulfovibrionales bacterium]|nr:DNA polymerase IV [Thermodesulfovibrionales bacterium]